MVSISECRTRKQRRQFEQVPERLHRADPAFVPPYPGSVAKHLAPTSAFHRRHGEIVPFIATRDGQPAGRIAAIVNRSHNTYANDRTGFFGFFECEDDGETAGALIDKAAEILRAMGFSAMRGPYNPSINDECGVLVEGFEHRPYIGLPWNPAFYERLITGAGFVRMVSAYGFQLPLHRLEPPARLARIAGHVARRSRIKLRPIDMSRLEEELKIVQEVFNDTMGGHVGFVPISMDDLLFAAKDMRAIADREIILIAEQDGENAGVVLSLPNFNDLLALVKRTPIWLRPLHVLWLMKTRRIQTARQVVYGISPRFRDRGLHGWLLYEHFVCAKARYTDAELGWIQENNIEILENARMAGGIQHREWRIYEKPL